jgi:CRISPR-associated protein Csb2
MSNVLCITVRFLDPMPQFHGRADGGEPEWPPSPLRLFQALVDAAASRWRDLRFDDYAKPFLRWLEKQAPPTIIAPIHHIGVPVRIAVPNNDLDVWAGPLSRGLQPKRQPNELKTMKTVRTTRLIPASGDAVHYLFPLAETDTEFATHHETLCTATRSITHLGWGVDMVAGNASEMSEEETAKLTGERWRPAAGASATQLRVPRVETLLALMEKHTAFLNRLPNDGFRPMQPLTAFDMVGYRRDTDPASREYVAFRIMSVDPDDPNPAFDTSRRCRDVAAWVRHATGEVCKDWPFPNYAAFVHGHDENGNQTKGERADERFMYLPLPTINHALNRVKSIRRVLIAAPPGFQDRIDWIRRRLPGQELVWDNKVVGLLNLLPTSDWVLNRYIGPKEGSRTWSTVTPVVWPGHDDRDPEKAERILRRAFVDAGVSRELVDGITEIAWRPVGFRAGADLASRYCLPDRLKGQRYHVRVRFAHPIRGPLAVGAGRYRGFGLFAAESD